MAIHIKRVIRPDNAHEFNRWHSTVYALDRTTFPGDDPIDIMKAYAWVAFDGKTPVGFICMDVTGTHVRVMRYGVLASHRGVGLGKRLLRAGERFARVRKAAGIISYTMPDNASSINALIRYGYDAYTPKPKYAGAQVVYWRRRMKP